jgi:ABC-2 type transport system permease protein
MQAYLTLTRRDLGGYFVSLAGYVIIAAASFLLGWSFVVMLIKLRPEPTPMPLTEMFYQTPFFWIVLLLAVPVITMRLFALEKYSGTYETLMTTPVTDIQVVLAKFTAALIFYMVMWLPLLACLFILEHFGASKGGADGAVLFSTYLGIFLLGCMFLSLGCLASAMTRNQTVAAMMSLALGFSLFLLGFVADQLPSSAAPWQQQIAGWFTLFDQMHDFARGVVDTRPVILYLSFTFLFLFLTLRVVESRRWK